MSLRANSFAHCFTFYWLADSSLRFGWSVRRFDCLFEHTGNRVMKIRQKNHLTNFGNEHVPFDFFFSFSVIVWIFRTMDSAKAIVFFLVFFITQLLFSVLHNANQTKSIYRTTTTTTTTDGWICYSPVHYIQSLQNCSHKLPMSSLTT